MATAMRQLMIENFLVFTHNTPISQHHTPFHQVIYSKDFPPGSRPYPKKQKNKNQVGVFTCQIAFQGKSKQLTPNSQS